MRIFIICSKIDCFGEREFKTLFCANLAQMKKELQN